MKQLTIPAAFASLALVLAACGGSAKTSHPTSNVLVDSSGMALYSPEGESANNVRCTGACASIWKPLRPGAAQLAGSKVITRPDGSKQLAIGGKPLYTFVQDAPGSISGNGASDAFGAKQFTWHVVTKGGGSTAPTSSASPTRGYGSNNGY
jgi:predicted lipoprotein with Yx(FWY)xxD motif